MYRFFSRGFVALAEGRYSEAFENFQSVTKLDPENSSVRHSFEFLFPSSLFTLDGLFCIINACTNNIGINISYFRFKSGHRF